MRVLHVVPALYDRDGRVIGGAERYVLELARHMAREARTVLVSFGEEDLTQTLGDLRIRVIGRPWHVRGQRFNPIALTLFREVLQSADVVHCHQQHVLASSLTALLCRVSGRRVYCTDLGGGGWDISGYVRTDSWYHGHLHISEYSRHVAAHRNNPRAHVILGGVDSQKFSPSCLSHHAGGVLFVGRILPHKGVDYLIEAIPPDLRLDIYGGAFDVPFFDKLQERARGKDVHFVLRASDDELVEAYRAALCIVLPSVYRAMNGTETNVPELLGQTLLEGMACGIPAICTNVASMPEVVKDGMTGFVVPPNDPVALREKVCWLRDHPAEAKAMGQAARAWVLEQFTWPEVVRRCLDIYQRP